MSIFCFKRFSLCENISLWFTSTVRRSEALKLNGRGSILLASGTNYDKCGATGLIAGLFLFKGFMLYYHFLQASLVVQSGGKESACKAGDPGSIPVSGRSPGEGNGNPLQYSCLENPVDRGAWQATVHRVAGSDTTERLIPKHTHTHTHTHTFSTSHTSDPPETPPSLGIY